MYEETSPVGSKRRARMREQHPGGRSAFDSMERRGKKEGVIWRFHEPTETLMVLNRKDASSFTVVTVYPLVYGFREKLRDRAKKDWPREAPSSHRREGCAAQVPLEADGE